MTDLDALLNDAREPIRPGIKCWVNYLPEEAQQFLRMVKEARAKGDHIQYSRVAQLLEEKLGIKDVKVSRVGHHLSGRCRCE